MIKTVIGVDISEELVDNYFHNLVNRFFKILPMRESGGKTLPVYIQSLQLEILGCKELIRQLDDDSNFLSLVSILQYMRDNPDCPVGDVKREVFRAIALCNKIEARYKKAV